MNSREQTITICSDATGETAEAVVQATLQQFNDSSVTIRRIGQIRSEEEISELMQQVARERGFVVYTLVQPELREMLKLEAIRLNIRAVDVMGPMLQAYVDTFNGAPSARPGLLHKLDELYFRRIEAMEFAVKCDDGRETTSMLKADLVLIGVSRTSKTPLSVFLAHKGLKVANLPIVPEVKPPDVLFRLPPRRIYGLTMQAEHLWKIRLERLKTLGLPQGSQYAELERIAAELEHALLLYKRLGCTVIDVTEKAIEETAGLIIASLA